MKKLSSKQIFTYVALLGVLALIAVYFLVYQKNVEKTDALIASNANLESRVNSLKVYYDNEATYLAEMEAMEPKIDELLAPYEADILEEDVIMQAVFTQMNTPMEYKNINISENESIKVIPAEVVAGAGIEKYQKEIVFAERNASYVNSLDYTGLKTAVQSLFDSDYNIGIKSITYKKDNDEGLLSGTFDLAFYNVQGTEKEYVKPNILPYLSGTENIFGVITEEE